MVGVIGEALIDLVQQPQAATYDAPCYLAHPGGSPFNVAIGLTRLGQPTDFFARISSDAFGRQLRTHAMSNGLSTVGMVAAAESSTLAVVGLDASGNAAYDFYVDGTADWQWTEPELQRLKPGMNWAHTGSLASWIEPGASMIIGRLRTLSESGTVISFDPNVRPSLMPSHDLAVAQIELLVGLADVVKASAEDLDWLYPNMAISTVLGKWIALGPALVVVTDGAAGASAARPGRATFSVPGIPIEVVDTVGAGDSFMAGLINALLKIGSHPSAMTDDQVRTAVTESILVSALTCQRAGANPPTAAELAAAAGSAT